MRLVLMYKKNISFLFKEKVLESIPSKLPGKEVSHNWTAYFLSRVVLSLLSQIFFKKNEIDLKKKCIVCKEKMRLIFELQKVSLSALTRVCPNET